MVSAIAKESFFVDDPVFDDTVGAVAVITVGSGKHNCPVVRMFKLTIELARLWMCLLRRKSSGSDTILYRRTEYSPLHE